MVTKTYYEEENGLQKIAEYCQRDVIATAQLYLRLNNLPLIEEQQIQIVSEEAWPADDNVGSSPEWLSLNGIFNSGVSIDNESIVEPRG